MKLYSVHMWLLVTVKNRAGRSQELSSSKTVVLCAESEEAACAKAREWFQNELNGPVWHLTFSPDSRDATKVRFAESNRPGFEPVKAYEVDNGVWVK